MQYQLRHSLKTHSDECLILGFFADEPPPADLTPTLKTLFGRLSPKLHEAYTWTWQADIEDHSLMLIHCGDKKDFHLNSLKKCLNEISQTLIKQKIEKALLYLPALAETSANEQLKFMVSALDHAFYQLLDFKTIAHKKHVLESIDFYCPHAENSALKEAQALIQGIHLCRYLADLPANHCTPTVLAQQAQDLAQQHSTVSTKVLSPAQMKQLGMNALLAVAQGSVEPACLIEMHYQGGGDEAPIILVGKGITFDSGGLSLKAANLMDEMKYDMAGAASVLGTLHAAALMKLPINLIGLVACAENMPSGSAVKPGDIVTSLSGQTIEILNTDAEGRLVLADALTYAERFSPRFVVDIATLTGGIIVALGTIMSGLLSNNDELAHLLFQAGELSQDKCWRLPLDDAYQEAIESPMADMINAGFDRTASSITAACFLSRFTKKYPWAHLDVAGTAWVGGKKRQATGRPVSLLIQFLQTQCHAR